MARYLLAGGAGFIGSHLTDSLLADGHEVVVLDTFTTGRRDYLDTSAERLTVREADVTEPVALETPVDTVIHLASLAAPDLYQSRPIQTLRCGSVGTDRLLEIARRHDATFLFASTSEIYGDPQVHPQPESYVGHVDPHGPRSCYDESKRYGEAVTRAYREQYGIDTRIVRIFNTYGPRMQDSRVVPTFIRQALSGEPLTVHGDGAQTRSFCYIDDLVRGIRLLLRSTVTTPVNLGNTDERTIAGLAKRIIDLTRGDSSITHEPRPADDPNRRRPDISKAKAELNWSPNVGLDAGLRETINWWQSLT